MKHLSISTKEKTEDNSEHSLTYNRLNLSLIKLLVLLLLSISMLSSCWLNPHKIIHNSVNELLPYDRYYTVYLDDTLIGYAHEALHVAHINELPAYMKKFYIDIDYMRAGREHHVIQSSRIICDKNFRLLRFQEYEMHNDYENTTTGVRFGDKLQYDDGNLIDFIELPSDVFCIVASEYLMLYALPEDGDSITVKYFSTYLGEITQEKIKNEGVIDVFLKGENTQAIRFSTYNPLEDYETTFYFNSSRELIAGTVFGDGLIVISTEDEVESSFPDYYPGF